MRASLWSWNGVFGFYNATSYCEAFVMLKPEIQERLTVCEHWMIRANEPELEARNRDTKLRRRLCPRRGSYETHFYRAENHQPKIRRLFSRPFCG